MTESTHHEGKSPRPAPRRKIVALAAVALIVLAAAALFYAAQPDRATRLRQMDVTALRAAAQARPNDAEVFLLLGKRLRQSGDRQGGFVITNRAYNLSSGEPRFVAAMAGALMDQAD